MAKDAVAVAQLRLPREYGLRRCKCSLPDSKMIKSIDVDGVWRQKGRNVELLFRCEQPPGLTIPYAVYTDTVAGSRVWAPWRRFDGRLAGPTEVERFRDSVNNPAGTARTAPPPIKQSEKERSSMQNIRDQFFRQVREVVYDVQQGALAITDVKGNAYSLKRTEDGCSIVVNPIKEMTVAIPAFATRVPVEDLAPGDILIAKNAIFVTGMVDGKVATMDIDGTCGTMVPPTSTFFGASGVMVVRDPMKGLGGPCELNSMLPLLALGGDDNDKFAMLLFAMSSAGKTDKALNLLPLVMMMRGEGEALDPMMLMLMTQGGGDMSTMLPLLLAKKGK